MNASKLFFLYLLALTTSPCFSSSTTLLFIDQSGKPIENVVVSSPQFIQQNISEKPLIMDQKKRQFSPRILVAQRGQLVAFPNSDNIRHHVYSFSDAKAFELKLYSGENTEPVMFEQSGIVTLGCNIHDRMLGFIYVNDMPNAIMTGVDGKISVESSVEEITFWHPDMSIDNQAREVLAIDHQDKQSHTISVVLVSDVLSPKKSSNTFGSRALGTR